MGNNLELKRGRGGRGITSSPTRDFDSYILFSQSNNPRRRRTNNLIYYNPNKNLIKNKGKQMRGKYHFVMNMLNSRNIFRNEREREKNMNNWTREIEREWDSSCLGWRLDDLQEHMTDNMFLRIPTKTISRSKKKEDISYPPFFLLLSFFVYPHIWPLIRLGLNRSR